MIASDRDHSDLDELSKAVKDATIVPADTQDPDAVRTSSLTIALALQSPDAGMMDLQSHQQRITIQLLHPRVFAMQQSQENVAHKSSCEAWLLGTGGVGDFQGSGSARPRGWSCQLCGQHAHQARTPHQHRRVCGTDAGECTVRLPHPQGLGAVLTAFPADELLVGPQPVGACSTRLRRCHKAT